MQERKNMIRKIAAMLGAKGGKVKSARKKAASVESLKKARAAKKENEAKKG